MANLQNNWYFFLLSPSQDIVVFHYWMNTVSHWNCPPFWSMLTSAIQRYVSFLWLYAIVQILIFSFHDFLLRAWLWCTVSVFLEAGFILFYFLKHCPASCHHIPGHCLINGTLWSTMLNSNQINNWNIWYYVLILVALLIVTGGICAYNADNLSVVITVLHCKFWLECVLFWYRWLVNIVLTLTVTVDNCVVANCDYFVSCSDIGDLWQFCPLCW